MNEINPAPLAEVGERMADALGLRWEEDRVEVLKYVNLYRNSLFNKYRSFKLFDSVFHCITLQRFSNDCNEPCSKCDDFYWGATLPPDVAGVVAAWRYNEPLTLRSRWRETLVGRVDTHSAEQYHLTEMSGLYATERDLKEPKGLKVYAESSLDDDKKLYLEVTDVDNKKQKIEFTLIGNGWAEIDLQVKRVDGVVLPSGLRGSITLADSDGYELSIYSPYEKTVSYRRVKVANTCQGGNIYIQATKRPFDIYFDTDIVEVGDPMLVRLAGRYFRYWESNDINEQKIADKALGDLYANIDGLIARYRGNAIQDGIILRSRINRVGRLCGYTRR